MVKTTKRQVHEVKNDCSWFDTNNARLIILCALFGFVGAHKFAQGKKGQGLCFILLDLTIIGIVISVIWAFFNLLFLIIKKDNKPGNMILGSAFLLFGMILPLTISCLTPESTVVEVGEVSSEKKIQNAASQKVDRSAEDVKYDTYKLECLNSKLREKVGDVQKEDVVLDVFVKLYVDGNAEIITDTQNITLKNKTGDRYATRIYHGSVEGDLISMTVRSVDVFEGHILRFIIKGKLNGVDAEYECLVREK